MPYTPQVWEDFPDTDTPITAARLNNMESGIEAAGRGATLLVASAVADPKVQAAADYLCDGTDDDVQINAAIQALPAWGGRVLLSEGTFYLGASVTLDQNYTVLEGSGRVSTELALQNGENVDMVVVTGQLCAVRSLSLNGNKANQSTAGNGVSLQNTKNVVKDVWITSCYENGVEIVGVLGTPAHACRVLDSFITLCRLDGVAIAATYSYDCTIQNVWSGDNDQHGFSTASGETRFDNCHSWGNGVDGLRITATTQTTVIGCYMETNTGRGIRASGGSDHARILGSHFYRNASNGVYGFNSDYWTIQGCTFTENGFGTGGVPAISQDTGTHWTVGGNIFKDNQGTKTQTYAMADTGGADYTLFAGNMALAADHKTGSVSIVGTNRIIKSNQGPSDYPSGGTATPTGVLAAYAASAAPDGWLLCDGSAVSQATYADLYALIGTTYGNPGGGNFNLPDLRGRVPVGRGTNAAVDTLGENEGVTEANRRPQHRHTPHLHTVQREASAGTGGSIINATSNIGGSINTSSVDGGSGNANDSLDAPAYIVLNYIIKT